MFGSKPIHHTNITFPTRHKALQEVMRHHVSLDIRATLKSVNKVALLTITDYDFLNEQQWDTATHFAMMQYGFKKTLSIYPDQAEAAVGKELEQLHSRNIFPSQDITQLTHQRKQMALKSIMTVKEKMRQIPQRTQWKKSSPFPPPLPWTLSSSLPPLKQPNTATLP